MDDSGIPQGWGGEDWIEHKALEIAGNLVFRTDRLGAKTVTLSPNDIDVLRPVMPPAAGAEA